MSSNVHSHPFKFFYTRGTASAVEFRPHAGTRLAFQNRGVDTLQIRHPSVALRGGDLIKVTYLNATVFQGTVEQIAESHSGGSETSQDVLVASAWSKMDRLVFQQYWGSSNVWSSNTVLNVDDNGDAIGFKAQLNEIFSFVRTRCDVTFTAISGGQPLPADEVRDLTCAQAINRVLRWFPRKTVRFDYSGTTPKLELIDTTGAAPWLDDVDKSSVVRTYNAHPIAGVYLETVTTGTTDGALYREFGHQQYPSSVRPDSVDVLHATIMLKGASSTNLRESFSTRAEGNIFPGSAGWWIAKHPRLSKYVDTPNVVQVVEYTEREDEDDYPRIAAASVEELTKFGLKARVETFTARVKIATTDDIEEDLVLQMKFVTSNVVDEKVYHRAIGSSSVSGESIPNGLAQAIYEDRFGSLKSLTCDVRLGDDFPKIGETCTENGETLILQSFEVDVADLTASCIFGPPDHLSPDDMAGLMTGFRNRDRCSASWNRSEGKVEDDEEAVFPCISPVEATEFCPGVKARTTIMSSVANTGSIKLDAAELGAGEQARVHTLYDSDHQALAKIIATADVTIPAGGGGSVDLIPGDDTNIVFTPSNGKIKVNVYYK